LACPGGRSPSFRTTLPADRQGTARGSTPGPRWGRRPQTPFLEAALTFITIEGGEGAGKTTQARLLVEALTARGYPVLQTREPGGAPGAEKLRDILLHGPGFTPLAETLLHFAARAEHAAVTIRPALAAGRIVVCDRFFDSTMAYQGYGQGADRARIAQLSDMIGLTPDLTLVLDIDTETAATRLRGRGTRPDRYEAENAEFHARVAAGFRAIAAAAPGRCVLLPAGGTQDALHNTVLAAVLARLGRPAA
jgi:dTMP kinase